MLKATGGATRSAGTSRVHGIVGQILKLCDEQFLVVMWGSILKLGGASIAADALGTGSIAADTMEPRTVRVFRNKKNKRVALRRSGIASKLVRAPSAQYYRGGALRLNFFLNGVLH